MQYIKTWKEDGEEEIITRDEALKTIKREYVFPNVALEELENGKSNAVNCTFSIISIKIQNKVV